MTDAADEARLDRLADGTDSLRKEVQRLADTIGSLATKARVEEVAESAMTHDQHETFWTREMKTLVKLRKHIRNQTFALFALSIAIMLGVAGVLAHYIHQEHQQRVDACKQRDAQLKEAIPFYEKEITRAETKKASAAIVIVLEDAKRAAQSAIVRC